MDSTIYQVHIVNISTIIDNTAGNMELTIFELETFLADIEYKYKRLQHRLTLIESQLFLNAYDDTSKRKKTLDMVRSIVNTNKDVKLMRDETYLYNKLIKIIKSQISLHTRLYSMKKNS